MSGSGAYFLGMPDESGIAALSGPGDRLQRLRPEGADWIVEAAVRTRRLRRGDDAGTIVLVDESGAEAGRLSPVLGPGDAWPADVLLADGRVFRVALRAVRRPSLELRSWEAPGAYLTATVRGEGWSIEATTAGRHLTGLEDLVLMLCAGILSTTPG